jgi:oligopeptide transport system substrate-binding protein
MKRVFKLTPALLIALFGIVWFLKVPDAQMRNAVGKIMPSDAAPLDQQIFRFLNDEPTNLDIGLAIYEVGGIVFLFERLTMLDHNNQVIPGAATSWESSDDMTRWTFHMRPDARWSDGRPVTAHDFEYSYKRMLDPASASGYAFFYHDIKGARAFNTSQTPDSDVVGVRALDDMTLVIETEGPCPYLPMITAFFTSIPVPEWQVEKYGVKWATDENSVSNSSYKIKSWDLGEQLTFELDPYYNGSIKGYLSEIRSIFKNRGNTGLLAYENNELDLIQIDVRDLSRIERDPGLQAELHKYMDFNALYLFFKTREGPFADLKVRQAISHAIDREALCNVVLRGTALPAYTMLPPGFPGYSGDNLKDIQRFDPREAKRLLAEAGYPNGRGFPSSDIWLRNDLPHRIMASEAIAGMLKEHLNINVGVQNMEPRVYSDAMAKYDISLSLIPFQYDFPDPHNLLGQVWHTQPVGSGRHDWTNTEFDQLIESAAREVDPARRNEMYHQAERILVEDVGGAFVFHDYVLQLRKSWIVGWKNDITGQAPFFIDNSTITDLYVKRQ